MNKIIKVLPIFILFLVFIIVTAQYNRGGTSAAKIGQTSQDSTGWKRIGTNVFLSNLSDSVGIGTSTPTSVLQITGKINTDTVSCNSVQVASNSFKLATNTLLTASPTQTQGEGALTGTFNQVTTVLNDDDVRTLPEAEIGLSITVSNDGINRLQLFPAAGDDLGEGIDIPTTLKQGRSAQFISFNSSTWRELKLTDVEISNSRYTINTIFNNLHKSKSPTITSPF